MVTTRRQMRKRKSDGDTAVGTSTTTKSAAGAKRQKKLPVRAKDEPKLARGAVEAAEEDEEDDEGTPGVASSPRQRESSFVVEIRAKTDADSEKGMDDSREGEELITGDEQPAPEAEIEEASSQAGSDDDNDDNDDGDGDEELDEDDQDETPEDDLAAAGQPTALATSISEPSDDESDSDAAPEAVSTSKAAAQALESAKAANKAVAEQAKTQKRKRQERAARLQEQAQSRKEAAPQTPSAGAAAGTGPGPDLNSDDEDENGGLDEITPRTQLTQESNAAFSARRKRDQGQLPTKTDLTKPSAPHVLPAEYLDSDSEVEITGEDLYLASLGNKPPRKARKLATAERNLAREARRSTRSQEKVVGSTVYRVAGKKRDERLAPKGAKASANAKNALLWRGRAAVKPKGGFFVK